MMTEKKYERYYDLAGKASFENWESVRKSTLCPECFIDAVIGDASGIPIQEDVLEELNEWMFGDPDFHVFGESRDKKRLEIPGLPGGGHQRSQSGCKLIWVGGIVL